MFSPSRSKTRGREEYGYEARLKQHSVGLVAGEILRRTDERKEAEETDDQHATRPNVEDQHQGSDHPHDA